jgi:hypothetical protein
MSQHSKKFYAAVRTLAGHGPIKKRLVSAYSDNLVHLPVEELPEIIRPRFESLRRAMLSIKPLGGESPVLATVRKMSTTDANRCANQIVTMFSELERGEGNNARVDRPSSTQLTELEASRYHSLN